MFAASKTAAVSSAANYIEDVFSTYLYTGTGSSQTITNNIDLSGKGGLTWIKTRGTDTNYSHILTDTVRGATKALTSNTTDAEVTSSALLSAFTSSGFTVGTGVTVNKSGNTLASWTFREQPKFFDVVTYTGNGSARTIAHSLGSVPACMIIKDCTNAGSAWAVYHTSLGNTQYLQLQSTGAAATSSGYWNNTTPTSTEFTVGTNGNVNQSGATYVAYLFAHNAGGFGLTGTDNVISCGSFTTDGSGNATVNLGYEPQWVLIKYNSNDSWRIFDNMRGMSQTNWAELYPNTSDAEVNRTNQTNLFVRPNATGFTTTWSPQAGNTAIYIAIRRGPMKVPTSGTSVFAPTNVAQASAPYAYSGFPVDMAFRSYTPGGLGTRIMDRLRGASAGTQKELNTTSTAAETDTVSDFSFTYNTGISATSFSSNVFWMLRRAPSFFDEVCYTGTGSLGNTLTHNLGVTPELMIVKARAGGPSSGAGNWVVYTATTGNTAALYLNDSASVYSGDINYWNNTSPTATQFTVGLYSSVNGSAETYVAYLFATCAGVSKVGSYTGTGTTKQIDCGFTGGARFVLIKRTNSTGDWYVWDSARGIVAGNDPYLLLNSTAAEVTNTDYVDTYSAGFEISSTAPAAINASGGTFIFLAIA